MVPGTNPTLKGCEPALGSEPTDIDLRSPAADYGRRSSGSKERAARGERLISESAGFGAWQQLIVRERRALTAIRKPEVTTRAA